MTPPGKTGPANATIMFYSETPGLTVEPDPSSRVTGDKIYVYAQAYPVVGQGDDDTAKAAYLNTDTDIQGSEWSAGVSTTIK